MKKYKLKNGIIVTLREGNGKDARRVIEYIQRVAGESDNLSFGEGEFNTTVEEETAFIETCKTLDNCIFLIAEHRGRIIGCLTFSGGNRSRLEHYGEFGVSVLKRYWGLGLGRMLIEYLIEWARKTGIIKKINLKVKSDNTRAVNLYEELGFIMEGTISRFFYHKGRFHDVYVMGLEIE
ncbi:GNAT family N-acetyltransferase [Wukongibacter sp. M2B1]|uniref:GNAT family N-acetyltransferase n=1 Tax=Wukongibacter sp. M2B1 TaxID=3088895 RepID=UPI003D7935AC